MIDKLTIEQAIVVTGFTGIAACDFGAFHADVEKRLGRPVWTHEFPALNDTIKSAYRDDFIAMCPVEAPTQGAEREVGK